MAEVRTIADPSQLSFSNKHINARKALIHQTDEVQVNLYVLQPGGRIPAHEHSKSWDISFVVSGRLEASFLEDGQIRRVVCAEGAVNLVPPGTAHEVSNPSPSETTTFLLIQSPSKDFDFLPVAGFAG
jgi:quercetin dioxygenase-like cupin family protein